jgi:L-aminopeptidase/D-esterase-like protein
MVQHVDAVLLSGGSAYGLAAADGVMRYLEEHGVGYPVMPGVVVPIVPAAILFDLGIGRGDVRPDAHAGYAACQNASSDPVSQGSVGAGTGCRVGALLGNDLATKGGIGSATVDLGEGLLVSALIAVNALGDVVNERGDVLAGVRRPDDPNQFMGALNVLRERAHFVPPPLFSNTVIGVVATNARLTKEEVNKIAQMAQDGLAQAVRPAHTWFDGDTLFALATGEKTANANVVGAFAAEVVARAIRQAVWQAGSLGGIRGLRD